MGKGWRGSQRRHAVAMLDGARRWRLPHVMNQVFASRQHHCVAVPGHTVNISVLFNVVLRKSFTHCVARSPVIRLRRQIDDIFRNTSARPDEDATGYTSHICAAFSGSTVHQTCLSPSGDRNVMLVSVEEDHIVEGPQLQRSLSIFTGHVLQVSRNYPLRAVRNKLVE